MAKHKSLPDSAVTVSAPGRIDIAGRLDLPRYFFQLPAKKSGTLNLAINLRTAITFLPTETNRVIVCMKDYQESSRSCNEPAGTQLPYFWRIVNHFRPPNGRYIIETDIQPHSGLGGSSAFVIALISLIRTLQGYSIEDEEQKNKLFLTSYLIENSMGRTSSGFQDYLAAIWGGGNYWIWEAFSEDSRLITKQNSICSTIDRELYKDCILIAYSGEPHASNCLQENTGVTFSSGDRALWMRIARCARLCACALKERSWDELARLVKIERELWLRVCPEKMSLNVATLINEAGACGVASRFSGVPTGGAVWALGSPSAIKKLRLRWSGICRQWPAAKVISVEIDSGVSVNTTRF